MRLIINIILILVILGLVYVLASNIREPIAFKAEKTKREKAVVDRLIENRTAQLCFRSITGEFASNYDTLVDVLKNGEFATIKALGDPDDPTNPTAIIYDTLYTSAYDSIQALGLNLDSLALVPYGEGKTFDIAADTITYQQTLVHVVEVGTVKKNFMGKYADPSYRRYDNSYDPNSRIKFGSLNSPNTSGNWER